MTAVQEPADAAKRAATYDKLALQQLLAPTRSRSSRAQRYQLLASAATIVPFIGIVELGRELLAAGPVNASRVWIIVAVVIVALLVRTLASGAALTITHFADVDLQRSLRLRIVEKLGRLPLGWFSATSSGEVQKAVQNDVGELHFLVAHSAVENTGALATPVFGLAYCFYLDWRLGLLALGTVPLYIGVYVWLGRDTRVQMERMNQGVERISTTIVEFIAGVSVVKTFGEAGKAHKRFADAADDFNDGFAEWVGPLVRVKAASSIFIDTPVLLLANLAGGYWFVSSGWVSPIEVLGSTLVAVTIPAAILTVGYSTHIRRQAAAAAGRLQRLLDTPNLPVAANPQVPQGNSVEFDAVTFTYDGEHMVLHDISLTLPHWHDHRAGRPVGQRKVHAGHPGPALSRRHRGRGPYRWCRRARDRHFRAVPACRVRPAGRATARHERRRQHPARQGRRHHRGGCRCCGGGVHPRANSAAAQRI